MAGAGGPTATALNVEYLRRKAGHTIVSVEYRADESHGFGRGNRTKMRFDQFLSELSSGKLYISSSEQRIGPHGFPDLMVSPLGELSGDFPSRLSWSGNLLPQQVNLWLGSSADGASSGLHHDYHDNFYVLLRGKKRFRLFPPSEVGQMQTYGEVVRVHENGRIIYEGQEGMNADGSHQDDVAMFYEGLSATEIESSDDDGSESNDDELEPQEPPSFSRATVEDLGVTPSMEFELHAGETLYLPAGWFHEVTSLNNGGGEHMALNYWLHPPTNLEPGPAGFERPYEKNFWPDVFEAGFVRRCGSDHGGHGNGRTGWNGCRRRSIRYLKRRYGRGWRYPRRGRLI